MPRTFGLIAIIALLGLLASPSHSHAQQATPSPSALPETVAPVGLGSVTLPGNEADIVELLARMPATIAGQPRAPRPEIASDRVILSYGAIDPSFGPPLYLQAIAFSDSDFFPQSFTAGDYVTAVAGIPDFGTLAYGRDGSLVWILAASTAGVASDDPATPAVVHPIYTMTWGLLDATWIYSAAATTPEALEALLIAFVTTASTPPANATPDAMATNSQLAATAQP